MAPKPEHLLSVRDVSRDFGGLKAVDGAYVQCASRARITGLIGPNGAGKSTLIGIVGGAIKPTFGTVMFEGRDVTGCRPTGSRGWA